MLKYIVLSLLIFQPCLADQIYKSVFFKFDKDHLKGEILNLNQVPDKNSVFWIKGYIDPERKEFYNVDLGIKRAINIKKALIDKYNLSKDQVKIIYYGEDLKESILNHQKRRVEIIAQKGFKPLKLKDKSNIKKASYEEINEIKSSNSPKANYIVEADFSLSQIKSPYKHRYYFSLGSYYSILLAKDRNRGSEFEGISRENYNFKTQYQFKYKSFWLGATASYHVQSYEPELNLLYIWNKNTSNLFNLSLVSNYEKRRWGLGFNLDFNQVSFIHEEAFYIELRDALVVGTSLQVKYKWFKAQKWSSRIGLDLNYPILGSGSLDPKGDLGYIGFIDLKRDQAFWRHIPNIKLYYGFNNYTNNENDQKEEVVGFLFSLTSLNWF